MKVKWLAGALIVILSLVCFSNVVGASITEGYPVEEIPSSITPDGNNYWEEWRVWSVWQLNDVSGPWLDGPIGDGPGTVTLSQSTTVSNSFSGTLRVTKGNLDASVGFNTTASWSQTASYSVTPPAGQRWQIIYRGIYEMWEVTQRNAVRLDGQWYWTNQFAYVYAYRWKTWQFSWRVLH